MTHLQAGFRGGMHGGGHHVSGYLAVRLLLLIHSHAIDMAECGGIIPVNVSSRLYMAAMLSILKALTNTT